VEFLSPDGMGWDLSSTALLTPTGISTATSTLLITVGGSYQSEPLIIATINTVTGGTGGSITVSNNVTLRGLTITRTWANGDVIEIDSSRKTLYVNDLPTEFIGQFPKWDVGPGGIGWLDDFTTRDVTLQASHTQRWL